MNLNLIDYVAAVRFVYLNSAVQIRPLIILLCILLSLLFIYIIMWLQLAASMATSLTGVQR